MATRMIARGRHLSTAVLVWSAAGLLGLGDLAAVSTHGDAGAARTTAFALAIAAGFLLGTALLRGIGSLVARFRIRQAMSAHRSVTTAQLKAEADRGIAQIEAFLADQHSRGN